MQVNASVVKDFQPVEMKIVFETKEELEVFRKMVEMPWTVTDSVFNEEGCSILQNINTNLREAIRNV